MILLSQCINVFIDHKNLTCASFNTDCVYGWNLPLAEFGPKIHYIPGSKNGAAHALSQLPYDDVLLQEQYKSIIDDLSGPAFPLNY